VSGAGSFEGEGGREGGEERVEELIDSILARDEQLVEEIIRSTPPPSVSRSFISKLWDRLAALSGAAYQAVLRLIGWLMEGLKAVGATVGAGVKGVRSFFQKCYDDHFPSSSSSTTTSEERKQCVQPLQGKKVKAAFL